MQIPDANSPAVGGSSSAAAGGVERTAAAGGAQEARKARAAAAGAGDAVELSSFAQAVGSLQDGSPSREARIEELRQLVGSGQYAIDSQALAQTLIDDAIQS